MTSDSNRPFITLLASHWLSMLGVAFATTAGFSWLFVLPQHLRGKIDNPYIGILVFLIIPAFLFLGLALIPIGVFLARRHIMAGLREVPDRRTAWKRLGSFIVLMTFVNVVIGSQASYKAVQHMETEQFCGQSCHVMKPEFTSWKHAPHSKVLCVECHVAPGASGWFASKMSGTRQLAGVVLDTFPRPIASAMESNRLVSATETCERCHARSREVGSPLKIITSFKDDEQNSRTETVLMMKTGGPGGGIHGAHMGPGIQIRYAAADAKRQTIPWVEFTRDGKSQAYIGADSKPGVTDALPRFDMQCVDCHNRPAHSFQLPEREMDNALASGELSVTLPFLKKTGVELLKAQYASSDAAAKDIPGKLSLFYQSKYPAVFATHKTEVDRAGKVLVDIYSRNVFPDLKVTWGTYPNNLGHTDAPGCFRCHDDGHARASDKKTIPNDCSTCHQMIAVDEASPEVLKTLGITSSTKGPT